jgi:hypothetical protein
MCRTVGGAFVLLCVLAAVGADKPTRPQDQYRALVKEHQDAMTAYQDAMRLARTDEDRSRVFREKYPKPEKFSPKFLELAENNPKSPVAVDALVWIISNDRSDASGDDSPRSKAVAILLKDHVQSEKIGSICQPLVPSGDKEAEELLRAILEKNPNKGVQGLACLSLAQQLKGRAGRMSESQSEETEKLRKESEDLLQRARDKYAGVKLGTGTVGATAKTELYELRFLTIGKTAPDVDGRDVDGKRFKLSDYRGKVVLLDFWGNW